MSEDGYDQRRHLRDARRIQAAEDDSRMLAQRRDGLTYEQIGAENARLGRGPTTKSSVKKRIDSAIRQIPADNAEEARMLELERLDRRRRRITKEHDELDKLKQLPALTVLQQLKSVDARAKLDAREDKIAERYAALLGLDAPKRTEVTGADGGPVELSGANDELLAQLSRLADRGTTAGNSSEGGGEPDAGASGTPPL